VRQIVNIKILCVEFSQRIHRVRSKSANLAVVQRNVGAAHVSCERAVVEDKINFPRRIRAYRVISESLEPAVLKNNCFSFIIPVHSERNKIMAGKIKAADCDFVRKLLDFIRGKIELVRVRAESDRNSGRNLRVAVGNCKFRRFIRAAVPAVRNISVIPRILEDSIRVVLIAENMTRNKQNCENKQSEKSSENFVHVAILYFYIRRIYTVLIINKPSKTSNLCSSRQKSNRQNFEFLEKQTKT